MGVDLTLDTIVTLDELFEAERPITVSFNGRPARFVFADAPADIYKDYDFGKERLATATEVMRDRVASFRDLQAAVPELEGLFAKWDKRKKTPVIYGPVIGQMHRELTDDLARYASWRYRITTSTQLIRIDDAVYATDGLPFGTVDELAEAFRSQLSDGGIPYPAWALQITDRKSSPVQALSLDRYLQARGGHFTGQGWLEHPVFSMICTDSALRTEYVAAMQIMSMMNMHSRGIHSGWCPGSMQSGYGRPIALGMAGEAFYPPNNSTRGHAAIVVPKKA